MIINQPVGGLIPTGDAAGERVVGDSGGYIPAIRVRRKAGRRGGEEDLATKFASWQS